MKFRMLEFRIRLWYCLGYFWNNRPEKSGCISL